ncbi:helix-turn-helix domain-containing protein [Thauera sp.]|jgi:excisionase family DNA binding protein|uniref:helix-turn-helix domain-containing protein n=1 Tax=Thauera sp. TaxID=1905334 RepID=UPI002A36F2AA|nr:helix-turn-helix domain-containing protein [Thauera sp.]MDX9887292.1 helix-turn-helix domain-containing protein [Thauera sp.]
MPHQHPHNLSVGSVDLLDEKAAAAFLDLSPGTLSVWRSTGRYRLPFVKIGRKVRYRRADLHAWLSARVRESGATS